MMSPRVFVFFWLCFIFARNWNAMPYKCCVHTSMLIFFPDIEMIGALNTILNSKILVPIYIRCVILHKSRIHQCNNTSFSCFCFILLQFDWTFTENNIVPERIFLFLFRFYFLFYFYLYSLKTQITHITMGMGT